MEIIVLHPHLMYPGGASKHMLEVSHGLVQKGIKVTVILTKYDKRLIQEYQDIHFVQIGNYTTGQLLFWLTFPIFFIRLIKTVKKIPHQLLFPQIFPPIWWAALIKIIYPSEKIVWMCHEPSAFIHSPLVIKGLKQPGKVFALFLNPLLRLIDKYLVRNVDYIIANSLYSKSLIQSAYGRVADLVAYPSVDPQKFKPVTQKNDSIFTISRLDRQKNIDLLVNVYSLLPTDLQQRHPLVIGGEGSEKNNLIKLVKQKNLDRLITFIGKIPEEELIRRYSQAVLCTFFARNEPFGLIPIEAMSCGTPVVGFKSGGVAETIIDRKTGLLLTSFQPPKVAQEITSLLNSPSTLRTMSKSARTYIINNFSWNVTVNNIYQLFTSIN